MLKGIILGILAFIALLWVLFCFWIQPAVAAEQICGPRREVIDKLKAEYGEQETWVGRDNKPDGAVLLLLSSSESGSWTLLRVLPDVACAVAVGRQSTILAGKPV